MPEAASNVGGIQAPQADHPTKNLSSALKEVSRHLGKMLLDAFKIIRSRNTQAAPPPPPEAQPPQGAGRAGQAATANPAQPAPVFDARKWLTEQCKQLNDALGQKIDRKHNLQAIYNAAKSLKNSIPANLPQDLEQDFLDNVAIIQNYFNSDDNTRAISRNELRFLHAYINFLKTCVSAHPELEKSLADVSSALHKALTELNQDQQLAQDIATQLTNEAARLRTEATNARQSAQAPAQGNAAEANDRAERLTTQAQEAERRAEEATRELDRLRQSPEEKAIAELNDEIVALDQRTRELTNTIDELIQQDPNSSEVTAVRELIDRSNTDLAAKRTELTEAENALPLARAVNQTMLANTRELTTRGNTRQIARVLPGNGNFNGRHLEQTQQQLKDTVKLLHINKQVDKDWLNHSVHFQKLGETLAATPQAVTSLPADFEQLSRPQDKVVNEQKVGSHTVYGHAMQILANNGNGEQLDTEQKILACQVLGNYSAMQAVRNSNSASYSKSAVQMTNAAQLLAASLTRKFTRNTVDAQQLKLTLTEHAKNFDLKELEQVMDVIPEDATREELQTLFQTGVTLAAIKTSDESRTGLTSLIKQSTTNRTYEYDVTALSGASRQKVFKESILRALALLSDPNTTAGKNDDKESRTSLAEGAAIKLTSKLASNNQATLERLVSNNPAVNDPGDELLNQLTLASMVFNDLSLDKGHVSRGSMMIHFNKYYNHPQRETLKNHTLHGFKALGEFLTAAAIHIRPHVNTKINEIQNWQPGNDLPSTQEIDRLIKKIIVTTDTEATGNENFKFRKLISTAESLKKSRSVEDLKAFQDVLSGITTAWEASKENHELKSTQWLTGDQRSSVARALKSNPVKSIPFINQIPVVGRLTAITSNLAKGLLAATVGVTGGAVALGAGAVSVAAVVGGAVVAAPIYGAYKAIQKTF